MDDKITDKQKAARKQMEQVMRVVFGDDWDRHWNEGLEQGRRETQQKYEAILADKDRALADKDRVLEEMMRKLQAFQERYGMIQPE